MEVIMTDLMNIGFVVFGSLFCQTIYFVYFQKEEMERAWFGWTIVTESFVFGLVPGFTNEFIFWMSEVGLVVGMLIMAYTTFQKEFLPTKINKMVYFYPTLPKIKLCCEATK